MLELPSNPARMRANRSDLGRNPWKGVRLAREGRPVVNFFSHIGMNISFAVEKVEIERISCKETTPSTHFSSFPASSVNLTTRLRFRLALLLGWNQWECASLRPRRRDHSDI